MFLAVLRIRIHRIHVFFGLLDPDPDLLVRVMDSDPDLLVRGMNSARIHTCSGSFYHHAKIVRKTLIPTVL